MRFITLPTVLLAVILTVLAGCATKDERSKGASEQDVYEMAQKQLDSRNWLAAIEALQLLEENFPFGTYGEQAQLELMFAHYQAQNFEQVVATADRFIRLHPQHRHADYAYYMRGLASFNQERHFLGSLLGADNTNRDPGAARGSLEHFAQFIRKFPSSSYAPDAQKRMIYLRNVLARSEIHVANYYFKRGAYMAAANRGGYVVENFQQSPAVPDGLAVMAHAYYLLKLDELADDAVKVLAKNYPDYPALDAKGEFNKRYYDTAKRRNLFSYLTFGVFDRAESQGFDTREIYDPEHFEPAEPPKA